MGWKSIQSIHWRLYPARKWEWGMEWRRFYSFYIHVYLPALNNKGVGIDLLGVVICLPLGEGVFDSRIGIQD